MILIALIAFGLAAAAAALALVRLERTQSLAQGAVAAPAGDAAAAMVAWGAVVALSLAGLISIGIPRTAILLAGTLIPGRLTPAHPALARLYPVKLPIAVAALVAAIAALTGTLQLIQGV